MEELLTWVAGDELVPATPTGDPLLVADSWLVQDGRARGLELHRRRFTAGCADAAGVPEATVTEFWRAAIRHLPCHGDLFPRIELIGGAQVRFWLRIRPAPHRGTTIRVWLPGRSDQRRTPRRKGPDLGSLGVLRSEAMNAGADDALLTTRSGLILESATASLIWWDGDQLCVPDPALPVLPGVTARLIRAAAAARGITIVHRRSRLAELAGRETWLVNALHGIRPVTAWVGASELPGRPARAPEWRRWWQDASRSPFYGLSARRPVWARERVRVRPGVLPR
jgi:branched-subunit amino acid aminotransferase/4-amino-4-deoxychorismate lyase